MLQQVARGIDAAFPPDEPSQQLFCARFSLEPRSDHPLSAKLLFCTKFNAGRRSLNSVVEPQQVHPVGQAAISPYIED